MAETQLNIPQSLRTWWSRERAKVGKVSAGKKLAQAAWPFLRESMPEQRWRRYGDMDYDWQYRVDTTSATVGWRTRLLGLLHSPYQPIEPQLFREMIGALPIEFEKFTFIDLGSGKGRALLLAAEYPFQRIIGVELLPELNKVARENIGKFSSPQQKCRKIEAVCGDANEFDLPREQLVVLLFNPLPESGLRTLIRNVEKSLNANPRPIYVLYANPILVDLFEGSPLLVKVGGTHQYTVFSLEEPRRNES